MPNVTKAEVRYLGNWTALEVPDGDLDNHFIIIGDAWIQRKLSMTLTAYTALDANKGAIAKSAELYYIAYLIASRPSKEDFQVGPARSQRIKGEEIVALAKQFKKLCKEQLSIIGITWDAYEISMVGGNRYHPKLDDDTQIDFGIAQEDQDKPFNPLGSDYD